MEKDLILIRLFSVVSVFSVVKMIITSYLPVPRITLMTGPD